MKSMIAMMGAKPLYLSSALMIEEGFSFDDFGDGINLI
jgi:hydrogenase maturation factor